MASPSAVTDQILVEKKGFGRVLVMNRPKQLNALSLEMLSRTMELFHAYELNDEVKFVVVKYDLLGIGSGATQRVAARELDRTIPKYLKRTHASEREERFVLEEMSRLFFADLTKYTLDYILATYSKPQISILDGAVMGGGAGLSVHGKFRVATENTRFAMPETAFGHFTDVGSSFYLSRLSGFLGEYLGLTGARLDGAEMLACGLSTHYVPSQKLSFLEEDLFKLESSDAAVISEVIHKYSEQPCVKQQSALFRLDTIDKCFCRRNVEEIIVALEKEAAKNPDDFINTTLDSLKKASPVSLKVSLRSIRKGRLEGIGKCLRREYRIACHVMLGHISRDFFEGCRAIFIDKDRNPKWSPSKLELVTDEMVEKYFAKVPDPNWEDLNLTTRHEIPSCYGISKL